MNTDVITFTTTKDFAFYKGTMTLKGIPVTLEVVKLMTQEDPDLYVWVEGELDKSREQAMTQQIDITSEDIQRFNEPRGELGFSHYANEQSTPFLDQHISTNYYHDISKTPSIVEDLQKELEKHKGKQSTFLRQIGKPWMGAVVDDSTLSDPKVNEFIEETTKKRREIRERMVKFSAISEQLEHRKPAKAIFDAMVSLTGFSSGQSLIPPYHGRRTGLKKVFTPEDSYVGVIEYIYNNADLFNINDLETFIEEAYKALNLCRLTIGWEGKVMVDTTEEHVFRITSVVGEKVTNHLTWKQSEDGYNIRRGKVQ